MRRNNFAAIVVLIAATVVLARPSDDEKKKKEEPTAKIELKHSLEELMTLAIKNSSEIHLAEAKVRESEAQMKTAEATLRQVRMQVAQKVLEAHKSMEMKSQVLANAEKTHELFKQLRGQGTGMGATSKVEVLEKERSYLEAKEQFAQLEAQIQALTGDIPGRTFPVIDLVLPAGSTNAVPPSGNVEPKTETKPRMPTAEMAAKMRKVLAQKIKLPEEKIQTREALQQIRAQVSGVPFLFLHISDYVDETHSIDFKGDLTLASCMQLIEDTTPLRFAVRDYGFLVGGGWPPEDCMSVHEFAKTKE